MRARLLALALLAGCSRAPETILVGAAGPFSRAQGEADGLRGIRMALEEANARGGIGGRLLELEVRDDLGEGERATRVAQEFVTRSRVVAVAGHMTSPAMLAAARVYDGRLVAVATGASSPELSGISRWVFRVVPSDTAAGRQMAEFAARLGARRVGILYQNDSYGRGLAGAFREHYRGTLIGQDPFQDGETNFLPFVRFYGEREPDLLVVVSTMRSAPAFLRAVRGTGTAVLGAEGWAGVAATPEIAEGVYMTSPFSAADPRPETRRFVRRFRERYGRPPDHNAALGYDAMSAIVEAIEAVGADRAAIQRYLASPARVPRREGVTGGLGFNASGDPVGRRGVVLRVRAGELVIADPQLTRPDSTRSP